MKASTVVTAEEAVASIGKKKTIYVSGNANEPKTMAQTLQQNAHLVSGSRVIQALTLTSGWTTPGVMEHIRMATPFPGHAVRNAVNAGHADLIDTHLSLWPGLLETEHLPDAVIVQVSPPDDHGFCSLGLDPGLSQPAVMAAKQAGKPIIAEVNSNMPCLHRELLLPEWDWEKNTRLESSCSVPYDWFDMVVETDNPLMTFPMSGEPDEISQAIGRHIAEHIRDGDTLQLGIGSVPDAVLACLGGFKDLGIHSEMVSDGVYDLWEQGVITGKKKNLLRGKMVIGFVLGDRIYSELGHSDFCFLPQHWVNDPRIIARNRNMVSVNSALSVDLAGNVCASTIGSTIVSSFGGQRDFVLAARESKGGRSFIALPSTYLKKDGSGLGSRIVSRLALGSQVTDSAATVDWVVTEYGAVRLAGKTRRERAKLLISIVHPDFREQLEEEARTLPGVMLN